MPTQKPTLGRIEPQLQTVVAQDVDALTNVRQHTHLEAIHVHYDAAALHALCTTCACGHAPDVMLHLRMAARMTTPHDCAVPRTQGVAVGLSLGEYH